MQRGIGTLGSAAAWPLAARTQQAGRLPTIGFLGASTPSASAPWVAALVQRLRELGWVAPRIATRTKTSIEGHDASIYPHLRAIATGSSQR